MPCDYRAIQDDNRRKYGTDIGRIGPMLLAHRYADRTHFIFELLQNAEDALRRRRQGWRGSRTVTFTLERDVLRVSHYGEPFNENDVRGICGIAESTKEDFTAIGRFGIGFKSVYAFTDRPQIHSGTEDFAIENFVWPIASRPVKRETDETVILVPLDKEDSGGRQEIAAGLERLGTSTLLFLHEIEEINWKVAGGRSGAYIREAKRVDKGVQQIDVVGEESGAIVSSSRWLAFAREVAYGGRDAGSVEIAFAVNQEAGARQKRLERVARSPLVVFFPTVLETHLGFLVQGPYRTTPSRDNVPRSDEWNGRLVRETASLLVDAVAWLRDHNLFSVATLRCLPLESDKFGEGSMFAPLFEATKIALLSEPLLPRFDQGHIAAKFARLARSQEIRDLFDTQQLAQLLGKQHEIVWVSGEITQDRTPELRRYLIDELEVDELTPETIMPKLTEKFLKSQPDAWVVKLYQFLNGQPALRWRLATIPLIRLEDGSHVLSELNNHPQAFLPGPTKTGFPTVRSSVCTTKDAREFLRTLGLTEPDPVDDVIHNVLPKYRQNKVAVSRKDYAVDIERILAAFATDSKARREVLIAALKEVAFVMVVDAGDGSKARLKPETVYLSTERLRELFSGVQKVFLVDDSYECLKGEDVREVLEACGATRYLQPIVINSTLSWEEKTEIRRNAGLEKSSWGNINDLALRGLHELLLILPNLDAQKKRRKAVLLWEALSDLETRRGARAFAGEYRWGYGHISKAASFDAAFVRQLNETEWVPNETGTLETPEFVFFANLQWEANPFMLSKIRFKPPIIETLAKEAGIELGVLDLLKKLGVTSEADLRARLNVSEIGKDEPQSFASSDILDNSEQEQHKDVPSSRQGPKNGSGPGRMSSSFEGEPTSAREDNEIPQENQADRGPAERTIKDRSAGQRVPADDEGGSRHFISYIETHPTDDEGPDPDGLERQARLELEDKAIQLILKRDPGLQRTTGNNRGFDLVEPDGAGGILRWVEVKAMTGNLGDRPVCLSRAQFDCAWIHGEAYWLYVVENAGQDGLARLLRIQDPAGKAKNFCFDRGWRSIAIV